MHKFERRQKILSKIKESNFITTKELFNYTDEIGITNITARRDLKELELEGYIKLSFGAVKFIDNSDGKKYETTREEKLLKNIAEKIAIAKEAVKELTEEDVIFVSPGTTLEYFVKEINKPIKLLATNALEVFRIATQNKNIRNLMMIGGNFRRRSRSFFGTQAQQQLKDMAFTKGIFSATNINDELMIYNNNDYEAETIIAALNNCKEKIALIDSSKFGSVGIAKLALLSDIDCIITDDKISPEISNKITIHKIIATTDA
ncbi:DeoR/GlpR family DNA-binding transcription regulator [Spiroplasma sp. DGKH1]|uniref:DeoR/GlpR family DNA-binding transcription regulator n=1 Tax=Spiroplasma sp. DGKH1 TaxID=3050074 RepID=UPI0034C632BE